MEQAPEHQNVCRGKHLPALARDNTADVESAKKRAFAH
jgi:hypothetical protein